MHADRALRLTGERIDAGGSRYIRRSGQAFHSERLRHLEAPFDLLVVEVLAEAVIVGVEDDAGGMELRPHFHKVVHADSGAPHPKFVALHLRLDVTLPQLGVADPDFLHSLDGIVERAVPEAVALRAQHDTIDLGVRPPGAYRQGRK